MVGDGPDRDGLEKRAHELGIVRHCLFLGYQDEVAPYYAAFDALVLPSANEGTPVSAIEALASGTPVVATRVGGVPDVVRDGDRRLPRRGGRRRGDWPNAWRELAADPELRQTMGETGKTRVLERYSVDAARRRRRRALPQAARGEGDRLATRR